MLILDTTKLTEVFIACDDFMKESAPYFQSKLLGIEKHNGGLSKSEIMTICIYYHMSGFRCFKWYYQHVILGILNSYFPSAYSYNRFIQCMARVQLELFVFLHTNCLSSTTQANYIDAKPLVVCHNKRIHNHKVFKGLAQRGKTSKGWFYGFKLHAIINQVGGIVRIWLTSGNMADNNKELLQHLFKNLKGTFYGDKGYISSLSDKLMEQGVELITKLRNNMKKKPLSGDKAYYLKKRGLIETVFDQIVNLCNAEHSRHRAPKNFICNLWSALIAYSFSDLKPTILDYTQKEIDYSKIVLI